MFHRLRIALILIVRLRMKGAVPIGDQIVNDVSHYPLAEGLEEFGSLTQRPTPSSIPFDLSTQDQTSRISTGNVHEVPFITTQSTQQGSEARFQDLTATNPAMHISHILDGHRFNQPRDFIGTREAARILISGYDPFDWDWIHELDTPTFTEKDPEISYQETEYLWNYAQWQPLPSSAQPGIAYPVAQVTEKPMHDFSADTFERNGDTVRIPVASDSYSPADPGKLPSLPENLQGEGELNNDQEQMRYEELAPEPKKGHKLKKLRHETDAVTLDDQDASEVHYQPDSPMTDNSAPGPSIHDTGTSQLAENRRDIAHELKGSKKRKLDELGREKEIRKEKKRVLFKTESQSVKTM